MKTYKLKSTNERINQNIKRLTTQQKNKQTN